MPNMDDVWLSIMHSAMDPRTAGGPLVSPAVDPEPSQPEGGSTSQSWRLFTVFPRDYEVSDWELEPKLIGQTLLWHKYIPVVFGCLTYRDGDPLNFKGTR